MAYSISNKEQVGYALETTWGTIPTANPLKLLRVTKMSAKTDTTNTKSAELVNSREVADFIRTERKGSGQVDFELSYGMLDDIFPGITGGSWAGTGTNYLNVGQTKQSFTIERQFTDISQFETYSGCMITDLKLNLAVGKVIDGSFSFVGKSAVINSSTQLTGTTAAPTNVIMNPIDNIQLIQENGTNGNIIGVQGATINLKMGNVNYTQIDQLDMADIEQGLFEASGTIDIYWQNATYITKYLNWTATALEFDLGGSSHSRYNIIFNKVKLTAASTDNGGMNQPLVTKYTWSAYKDTTLSTIQIQRVP